MRHVTTPAERPPASRKPARELNRLVRYWYLAEWKHAIATGRPITNQPFRRAHTSANEHIIEAALARNDFPRSWLARARLPRTAWAAVNHVRRTCNLMRPSELDRLVRSTHPYLTLSTGDPINFPILVTLDAYETKAKQDTLTPLDLYNALVLASRHELLQYLAEGVVILAGVPPLPEPSMRAFAPLIARGWDPEPAHP